MDDVRKAAEERASRPRTAEVGASFESERQRSKNALVKQLDALDGRNVRKIAAAAETPEEEKILRVAAYCRVSTDDIDQAISIHLQIQEYKKKILANPNWKYVGTYVDDGFSGTNTDHRQGFQKLMKDAMDGKIDMIITKAVSRFARNLMDCIGWVEALQNHDPPVRVFFEQENLDTLSQTSGIILFVLAMVAQEESHMKSEAILLSLEWRFSRGRFLTPRLFGYDKIEVPDGFGGKKKILSVNEAEARVVRWMYSTLLNGGSPEEIAEVLTEMAIPTGGRRRDGTVNTHWTSGGVISVMEYSRNNGNSVYTRTAARIAGYVDAGKFRFCSEDFTHDFGIDRKKRVMIATKLQRLGFIVPVGMDGRFYVYGFRSTPGQAVDDPVLEEEAISTGFDSFEEEQEFDLNGFFDRNPAALMQKEHPMEVQSAS